MPASDCASVTSMGRLLLDARLQPPSHRFRQTRPCRSALAPPAPHAAHPSRQCAALDTSVLGIIRHARGGACGPFPVRLESIPMRLNACLDKEPIMKSVAAIAAVLMLQGTIARAQPAQQCSIQSAYPSPVDANGKPIGALVEVDLYSQVGVGLDDLPRAKSADVCN